MTCSICVVIRRPVVWTRPRLRAVISMAPFEWPSLTSSRNSCTDTL